MYNNDSNSRFAKALNIFIPREGNQVGLFLAINDR